MLLMSGSSLTPPKLDAVKDPCAAGTGALISRAKELETILLEGRLD